MSSQEKRAKTLHRELEGWREVFVAAHSLLIWDKPFYPAITASVTSLLFLLIWYLDPSVLTLVSLLGLVITLADYIVPQVCAMFFGSNSWTGDQERRYEQVIGWLACAAGGFCCSAKTVSGFKASHPKLYFLSMCGGLLFTAYLGSSLNNLFLTYLIVLFLLLLPGLKQQRVVQQQFSILMSCVVGFFGTKDDKSSSSPLIKKKE